MLFRFEPFVLFRFEPFVLFRFEPFVLFRFELSAMCRRSGGEGMRPKRGSARPRFRGSEINGH